MTFLTILGVTERLCSFRLVLERKTGKEIHNSSRLEFLEKFSANNFAISDAEGNTSGSFVNMYMNLTVTKLQVEELLYNSRKGQVA